MAFPNAGLEKVAVFEPEFYVYLSITGTTVQENRILSAGPTARGQEMPQV